MSLLGEKGVSNAVLAVYCYFQKKPLMYNIVTINNWFCFWLDI